MKQRSEQILPRAGTRTLNVNKIQAASCILASAAVSIAALYFAIQSFI